MKKKQSSGLTLLPSRTTICFASVLEENHAEYDRRARQSVAERFKEFSEIQKRAFGKAWTKTPIKKIARCEKTNW